MSKHQNEDDDDDNDNDDNDDDDVAPNHKVQGQGVSGENNQFPYSSHPPFPTPILTVG
ncbi:hypothetical protein T08_290 [Trichinella sp. T8]|nr:hypothetical protein T08_290 [Trichinella sp. T8]